MLMGMKQFLVMMMAVVLVGCGEKTSSPTPKGKPEVPKTAQAAEAELITDIIDEMAARRNLEKPKGKPEVPETAQATEAKLIADTIVEMAVRRSLGKPEGELTKADLVEVTRLGLKKKWSH